MHQAGHRASVREPLESSDMSRVLIVVDVQRDFCEEGVLAVAGGAAVAGEINQMLSGDHGWQVVATRIIVDPGEALQRLPDFKDSGPLLRCGHLPSAQQHPWADLPEWDAVFLKGRDAAATQVSREPMRGPVNCWGIT